MYQIAFGLGDYGSTSKESIEAFFKNVNQTKSFSLFKVILRIYIFFSVIAVPDSGVSSNKHPLLLVLPPALT